MSDSVASKKFIFPITTGRSGTVYLYNLLKDNTINADVFHERLGFLNFGIHTPDASHFTLFNSVGNVRPVQQFWRQKFERDLQLTGGVYIEISHLLVKAGLLENIELLLDRGHEVHLIMLKRDYFKILWSFINRFDFYNVGFTWLFTLDYRYPNTIVSSKALAKHGAIGMALWYIFEMFTRAEYYRLIFKDEPRVVFHDCNLEDIVELSGATELMDDLGLLRKAPVLSMPGKKNSTKREFFGDDIKQHAHQLLQKYKFEPQALAMQYFESGHRLAYPKNVKSRLNKS